MTGRLRFHLENFLLRSPLHQLAFLMSVLVLMALLGGSLIFVCEPGAHETFPDAIWWAFLRLTDTGYMGEDHGGVRRFVSALLTFSGHIVFVGVVVAILTSGFAASMNVLASGRGQVMAENHVVVFGELATLENLLEELLYVESRARPRKTIVLLVPKLDSARIAELVKRIPRHLRNSAHLIFRRADRLDASSFGVSRWQRAECLILVHPGQARHSRALEASTFKLVLELAQELADHGERGPRLVIEVEDEEARRRFLRLRWPADFDVVPRGHFAAQLLSHVAGNPGLAELYQQLLTDQVGHSLHLLRPVPAVFAGCSVGEAVERSTDGLVLGLLRGQQVHLSELSLQIEEQDGLIVLGEEPRCGLGPPGTSAAATTESWMTPPPPCRSLLICGESPWAFALLRELMQEGSPHIVWVCERESAELPPSPRLEPLRVPRLSDYLATAQLRPDTTVLLLCSGEVEADAETIASLHALTQNLALSGVRPRVICELVDDESARLVRSLWTDVECVLSDRMLRHVVAQVAAKPALYEIYADLLAQGGSRFHSVPLPQAGPFTFAQAQQAAREAGAIAVGFFLREAQPDWTAGIHLAPAPERVLQSAGSPHLLVLEPEGPASSAG